MPFTPPSDMPSPRGSILITGCDIPVMSGAFPVLEECGKIDINNNNFVNIEDSWPLLTKLDHGIIISDNTLLESVIGSFDMLEQCDVDIPNISSYGTTVTGNTSLDTFPLFPAMENTSGIIIEDGLPTIFPIFPALTQITNLAVQLRFLDGNFSLANAFPSVIQIGHVSDGNNSHIRINSNPGLTSIANAFIACQYAGYFELSDNINLTTAANLFTNTDTWNGDYYPYVEIIGNTALTSLQGAFNNMRWCNYLELYDSPILTNVAGLLDGWYTGNDYCYIELYGNGALNLSSAFPNLVSVNYFEIYPSGAENLLGNLSGAFPALKHVDYIEIYDTLTWTTCTSAFSVLSDINFYSGDFWPYEGETSQFSGYIEFFNNAVLTNMNSSFGSLARVDSIEFNGNPAMTAIGGFTALTTLQSTSSNGELRITNNDTLTNITSLAALTTIRKNLYINENAALANIATLLNINGANFAPSGSRTVTIQNNALLPETTQAQALINNLVSEGYTGSSVNSGNLVESVPFSEGFETSGGWS